MTSKKIGESVRQKLTTLSSKLGIKYSNLETAFLIERLAARLIADKTLSRNLVFKGGFVALKVYGSPRYTIDLDALLQKAQVEPTLKLVKENSEMDLRDGVWFRFENQMNLSTQGEYGGIRHVYRAGIGEVLKNLKKAQIINFDLGIGDPITPAPQQTETPSYLSANGDLSWSVYPIETMIAEKLHALIVHGDQNSRSKDVYDLAIFLPKADYTVLKVALKRCFDFRKTELPKSYTDVLSKIDLTRLQRGWPSAISSIADAPKFKTAYDVLLMLVNELDS